MKQLLFIPFFLLLTLVSCENQPIEYDDFDYTSCYFPRQFPARTILQGNYDLGFNDNDNNNRFEISVTMGGVYTNDQLRKVYFEVDPTLMDSATTVSALHDSLYEILTPSPVIIPIGSTKGRILVELKDAFFDDTLALAPMKTTNYVIPVLISEVEELDSILRGKSADGVSNPRRLIPEDWAVIPKDYVLFGIKYWNKYHANYLRRGIDELSVWDPSSSSYEYQGSDFYHNDYTVRDEDVSLTTTGRRNVSLPAKIRRSGATGGTMTLNLEFDENDQCTIYRDSEKTSIGTGEFVSDAEEWGTEMHDAIYLNYSYVDDTHNEQHDVKDTLVVRDRGWIIEDYSPR